MNLFLIIQARMTSTRLPDKVILPLCDKSVLAVMLERLKSFHDNIIIATTDDGTEAPIINACKDLGVRFYQGSTDNVLERYYLAAKHFGATTDDFIIRCTSDCPLIDPKIVQDTIDYYKKSDAGYAYAAQESGFPRGMDTEIFSFGLLQTAYKGATTSYEKEHVTPYIKNNTNVAAMYNKNDHSMYRLTLDEKDDYLAIKEIYKRFNNKTDFSYDELIDTLKNNPYIYEINKHVEQKKYNN